MLPGDPARDAVAASDGLVAATSKGAEGFLAQGKAVAVNTPNLARIPCDMNQAENNAWMPEV